MTRTQLTALSALCVSAILGLSTPNPLEGRIQNDPWDVTIARGQTREIDFTTDQGTWISVDLSPDGTWVLFDLLGHVYRVPTTGGDAEALTQNSGIAVNYHPRYSPDGVTIAFISDRAGQDNLWVMNADGSEPRPVLLDDDSRVAEPTWTPDGEYIMATRRFKTATGFYRTNDIIWKFPRGGGEGEQVIRLESSGGAAPARSGVWEGLDRAQWPSVSPDGRYVYFNAAKFNGEDRHLQRIELQTGNVDIVTEPKSGYVACCGRPAYPLHLGELAPEISPDGRQLAFARKLPGGRTSFRGREYMARTALWVRDLQTGDERIIMDPIASSAMEFHPSWNTRALPGYSWARDGESIVISQGGRIRRLWIESGRVETIPFLARVHRTISEMARTEKRIDGETVEPGFLRWPASSRDGSRLVFEAIGQLWIMTLPSGTPAPLTTDSPTAFELTPTWSPNGELVAFTTSHDEEGSHLWTVRPGDEPRRMTDDAATYMYPTWSEDGRSIIVMRRPASLDRAQWTRVSISSEGGAPGVAPEPIPTTVPQRATEIRRSPDGRWVAFQLERDVYVAPSLPDTTDVIAEMRRLTYSGGGYPRWRNTTVLEFTGPSTYFAYDVGSLQTDTVAVHLSVRRATAEGSIGFTNARVLAVSDGDVFEDASLLVQDGRIACIGECDLSQADRIIDATGQTIMPGLLDVHAHHTTGPPILPQHRWSSANYLAYGVTTTHDPSTSPDPSFTLGEMIDAGRITGPRTYSTGDAITCGPWSPIRQIATYDDALNHVNRLVDQGAVSLKDYKLCTRRQRQMLTNAARERDVSVTAENGDFLYILGLIMDGHTGWEHALQYVPIYGDFSTFMGQARAHYSPQLILSDYPSGNAFEYWLGRDDLWLDDKVLTWSPWQAVSARRSFVKKPEREFMFPILAEAAADIVRAGGYVAVGAHGEQPGLGTHWELWSMGTAMTPMEALTAATLHPAHFLGLERDLGSIEVGKIADMVVLNSNPLDDLHNTIDIASVMKDGILYDATTLDEIWPEQKPYGPHPWTNDFIQRRDLRPDDYWDRRAVIPIPDGKENAEVRSHR